MRAQLDALMALLRQMLARVGWRLDQSGAGTQIGKVAGNVTVVNHHHYAPKQAVPGAPSTAEVLAVLTALEAYGKREAVLNFMAAEFGTRMVVNLNERGRKRAGAYARKVLLREQWKARKSQHTNGSEQ